MDGHASKVLVCYMSGTGCTKGVAEKIAETLERVGADVDIAPVTSKPNVAAYDAVVAGSGVRAGAWHPAAKKWAARNADALKGRPLALFTVGIALAHGPEKRDEMLGYTDKLLAKTGLDPVDLGVFGGWYEPQRFSGIERRIMKMAKAPEGDFRDWNAIQDWATGVARKLNAATTAI